MADRSLTDKQRRFVQEYLVDLNATQAAIRAGYSKGTAQQQSSRLLLNVVVADAVAAGQADIAKRNEITVDRVVAAIGKIAFSDPRKMFRDGRLLAPHEWDDDTAAAVDGFEVVTQNVGEGMVGHIAKVKRTDRARGLDMLMRHFGAYNDKLELTGFDKLGERLERAAKRDE